MENRFIKALDVKRKDGIYETVVLRQLDLTYVKKIVQLEQEVLRSLIDGESYSCSSEEEFEKGMKENVLKVLGCLTEDNKLIAMGVYAKYDYSEENYGYDLDIEGEELLKVGQIESTIVKEEYRGNKLQKRICRKLEYISKEDFTEIMAATVYPKNEYSLNTFLSLGYEVKKEKLKYGGYRRYILGKIL